ncbi:polymorphic toxin-type HINT domain-containing protein [Paenibacillus herberti]
MPVWMKDPAGAESEFQYDGNGNLTRMTNDEGHSTFYEYDKLGRVEVVTSPDGNKTTYTYDKAGRMKTVKEPGGGVWQSDYDPRGLLVKSTDPNGNTEEYTRNSAGLVTGYKDELKVEIKFTYDEMGRVHTTTDPKGGVETFTYDAMGRIKTYTDANKNRTEYVYDLLGRLKEVHNALAEKTVYRYDSVGNLIEMKTGSEAVTTWSYDAFGRLTEKTNAENETRIYRYDETGMMSESVDALGKRTTYDYDLRGLMTEKRMPDGEVFSYRYDSLGQLNEASTTKNKQLFDYDSMGRVSSMQNATWDKTVRFQYDERGNRTKVTDPEGNTQEYVYDLLNQIKEFTDPDGFKTTFEYDPRGAMTKVDRPNGIQSEYAYNENLQLVSIDHKGERTQSRLDYKYDAAGNIVEKKEEDGAITTYGYDMLNRIKQVQYPKAKDADILDTYDLPFKQQYRNGSEFSYRDSMVDPASEVSYTYDTDGNRSTMSADGKTIAYDYDAAGRMLSAGEESFTYDANGNLIQERGKQGLIQYSYNSNDMLEQALYADGSKVDYEYDAFQQKIGRKESYPDPRQQPGLLEAERVTESTYGEPVSQKDALLEEPVLLEDQMYYLNDGLTIMKEYGEDLEPIAQYYEANGQVLSRKSYRYNGWNVLDEESPIKQSEAPVRGMLRGDYTYYLNDHLGSVTHLTDRNGETLEQYRYDAFGSLMTPMTAEYNTIGYTGQTVDPKTGLMDYKARWYDSNAGRFTSADTYEGDSTSPLTLNLYSYVNNNPINLTDPTGNYCVSQNGKYAQPGECDSPDSIYLGKDSSFIGRPVIWKEQVIGFLSEADGVTMNASRYFSNYWKSYKDDYSYVRWLAGDNDYYYGLNKETQERLRKRQLQNYMAGQIKAGFPDFIDGVLWGAELATLGRLKAGKLLKACNCFAAGTKVLTDEGEKNIEDIEVGDMVLAKDENNPDGELAYKEVTNLYRNQRDDIIKLYVGKQVIETTDNHPFWVEGKGWVFADELQMGDKLQKADGNNLTIDRVEFVKLDEKVTVYNFTVADFRTYYVTDIGIWVHNTNCGIFSSINKDKRLVRAAEEMGKDTTIQKEADELIAKFLEGNTNPGLGSKNLFGNINYLRGKNGARVFYRMNDGKMEILGKSNKANEQTVIKVITELYK